MQHVVLGINECWLMSNVDSCEVSQIFWALWPQLPPTTEWIVSNCLYSISTRQLEILPWRARPDSPTFSSHSFLGWLHWVRGSGIPYVSLLVAWAHNIRWQHLIFVGFSGYSSPQQLFQLFSAITTHTIGEFHISVTGATGVVFKS